VSQVVDLRTWLVDEMVETRNRLTNQVLDLVPAERRRERVGGANSIGWNLFHVARHAGLSLWILRGGSADTAAALDLAEWPDTSGGGGLEEAEQPWSDQLNPALVASLLDRVLAEATEYLTEIPIDRLDASPDVQGLLGRAGIDQERYGWLWKLWQDQPASFFVRWPLLGHVGNHVGEMVGLRNQLGLSPF
jgi:DinB superfamily